MTYVPQVTAKCVPSEKYCRSGGKQRLKGEILHPWTQYMCEWVGISYTRFRDHLMTLIDTPCPIHDGRNMKKLYWALNRKGGGEKTNG